MDISKKLCSQTLRGLVRQTARETY